VGDPAGTRLQWTGTALEIYDAKFTMSGASSAIAIGTTPPTSASAGTGIWLDRTGMYGLAANVVQAKFDAATGAITAGAGNVALNVSGICLTFDTNGGSIKWFDTLGGTSFGNISGNVKGTSPNRYGILSLTPTWEGTGIPTVHIPSGLNVGTLDVDTSKAGTGSIVATGGLNVGSATGAGTGDVFCTSSDDYIIKVASTNAGNYKHPFSAYASGMSSGQNIYVAVGQSASTGNEAYLGLHYVGNNNAGNYGTLGLYAIDNLIKFYQTGLVYNASNSVHWDITSDERLKTKIKPLADGLAKILALQPRVYEWKKKLGEKHTGFVAQEYAQVFPESVHEADGGMMSINTGSLHEHLVLAIQELSAKVDALAARM
jgi:hypothetical protein